MEILVIKERMDVDIDSETNIEKTSMPAPFLFLTMGAKKIL